MSLATLLRHKCMLYKKSTTTNRLNESTGEHAPTGTEHVCFLQVSSVDKVADERAELLSVQKFTLVMLPGVNVQIGDKIENIVGANGTPVIPGTFLVETVAKHGSPRRANHLTIGVKKK